MTGVDIAILLITLISVVVGIMRGFIRESLSVVSWVVAIWLAITYCKEAGEYLSNYVSISTPALQVALGFASVFVICLLVFALVTFLIHKIIVQDAIKGTDRVLGVFFGVFRAVLIVAGLMVLGRGIDMPSSEWWQSSTLIAHLEPAADILQSLLPADLQPVTEQPSATDVLNSPEIIDAVRNQGVN